MYLAGRIKSVKFQTLREIWYETNTHVNFEYPRVQYSSEFPPNFVETEDSAAGKKMTSLLVKRDGVVQARVVPWKPCLRES